MWCILYSIIVCVCVCVCVCVVYVVYVCGVRMVHVYYVSGVYMCLWGGFAVHVFDTGVCGVCSVWVCGYVRGC